MLKTMLKNENHVENHVDHTIEEKHLLPLIHTEASVAVYLAYAAQHDTQGTAHGLWKGYITSFTLISPMTFTLSCLL